MKKYFVMLAALVGMISLAGCHSSDQEKATKVEGVVSGNTYTFDFPKGWLGVDGFEEINADADLMYGNKDQSRLVSVVAEPKANFENFAAYEKLVKDNLSNLTDVVPEFTKLDTMDGKKAEFSTFSQGMSLAYEYYILETDKSYIQLYSWSMANDFEKAKPELVKVMNSFKVISE